MKKDDDISDFLTSEVSADEKEEEPKKAGLKLFDYVKDLSYDKKGLALQVKRETGSFPREYVPYVAMKAFGNSPDTVLLANEVNVRFSMIDTEFQYEFFLYGIPKKKRFNKFFSENKTYMKRLQAIARYYECGTNDARASYRLIPEPELDRLVKLYEDVN